jgi:hypothetical protein
MTDSTGPDVPVLQERLGNVQVLTLNRPDRLNAWTDMLEDRYFELLDEADAHPARRNRHDLGARRSSVSQASQVESDRAGTT